MYTTPKEDTFALEVVALLTPSGITVLELALGASTTYHLFSYLLDCEDLLMLAEHVGLTTN